MEEGSCESRHVLGSVLVTVHLADPERVVRAGAPRLLRSYLRRTMPTARVAASTKLAYTAQEHKARMAAYELGRRAKLMMPKYEFRGAFVIRNIGGTHPRLAGHLHVYLTVRMKASVAFARWEAFIRGCSYFAARYGIVARD